MILASCQAAAQPAVSPASTTRPESATYTPAPQDTAATAPSLTPTALPLPTGTPAPTATDAPTPTAPPVDSLLAPPGEPAGCLSVDEQARLSSVEAMLGYADSLLALPRPLSSRASGGIFNAYLNQYVLAGSAADVDGVVSLDVSDISDEWQLQRILNALHVAGFVSWLRKSPDRSSSILALPLLDSSIRSSDWAPYLDAYWQGRASFPEQDTDVVKALKLPPCAWMVERGFAPAPDENWWPRSGFQLPVYAQVASAYLADSTEDALLSAQKIDWLGPAGVEGPQAMCGPLAWAIINGAGAFPPDLGKWSLGPIRFWFAEPRTDGRPWNLFPEELFTLHSFNEPAGTFDFGAFPLYPGDFLFTFSKGDGFDHMFVVTEEDADGSRYTVSNLIQRYPYEKMSVERVVLYNAKDATAGILRNQWAKDVRNGRTGHDGFDVFRWSWMEKNIQGQPVTVTVAPGDTLGLLAERWKTPPGLIAEYNELKISDPLVVGETVAIPPVADWLQANETR